MKKIEFIRWGGLSAVNHKKFFKTDFFHAPPLKKGVYVFHKDWVEPFLYAWKEYKGGERKRIRPRHFKYSGKIWTHLHYIHPEIIYYRQSGSWYETDTDCLSKLIKLEFKNMNKQLNNDELFARSGWICNPASNYMSRDHMEFFIEKI